MGFHLILFKGAVTILGTQKGDPSSENYPLVAVLALHATCSSSSTHRRLFFLSESVAGNGLHNLQAASDWGRVNRSGSSYGPEAFQVAQLSKIPRRGVACATPPL